MQECKPISTPMECGKDFNSLETDTESPQVPYQSLIGSGSVYKTRHNRALEMGKASVEVLKRNRGV
jgi:hypothetical protein